MKRHFRTDDHPEAHGRVPIAGEKQWTFTFKLDDGSDLVLRMGRDCHDTFRAFLLREELDDTADAAAQNL